MFNRGLSELKQRNDKKVSYEAELYDLQADIGDTIRIADNRYQEKLYLSARVQEVQNHYTVNGEDTGKLANYLLMESKRTQDVEDMLKELQGKVVSIDHAEISYQIGESGTEPPDGEWSSEPVDAEAGKYLWTRTITYYTNSSRNTAYSIAKSGLNGEKGESGDKGEDATTLRIESSRGTVFKNDSVATVLSVVIYKGSQRITDSAGLKSVFGNAAYLQWKWQRLDDESFGIISAGDERFGDNGFTFALSPEDVDTKVTFMCELIV